MINIHHIAIICSEREAALDFYSRKLGFPVIRENYREERDDWKIDLRINDSTELELFIMKGNPARRVDSVAEKVRELEAMGIPCEPIRKDTFTGESMTFFRDPDGLPIEIHE